MTLESPMMSRKISAQRTRWVDFIGIIMGYVVIPDLKSIENTCHTRKAVVPRRFGADDYNRRNSIFDWKK